MLYPNHPTGTTHPDAPPPLVLRVYKDNRLKIFPRFVKQVRLILARQGIVNPLDEFLGSATLELDRQRLGGKGAG